MSVTVSQFEQEPGQLDPGRQARSAGGTQPALRDMVMLEVPFGVKISPRHQNLAWFSHYLLGHELSLQ